MAKIRPTYASCQLLGVRVDILRWNELMSLIDWHISAQSQLSLSYANAHTINLAYENKSVRNLLNRSDITYCDGNGVRWGAMQNGINIPERHTGADWIWKLAQEAARQKWTLYWLGNAEGMTEQASLRLRSHFPELHIHSDHGFYPSSGPEYESMITRIESAKPDILLVGMGTPTQEEWIDAHRKRLSDIPILWAVGAAAEFVAQPETRPGPKWMTKHLEWVSRLASDPKRMWKRYLLGNPKFIWRILTSKEEI